MIIQRPHLISNTRGSFAVFDAEDGWTEVGADSGGQDGFRRRHWARFRPVAIRAEATPAGLRLRPFLTFDLLRDATALGHYHEAMQKRPGRLRYPDELVGAQAGAVGDPVSGMRWDEAHTLCNLAGGRLAEEKEIEALWPLVAPSTKGEAITEVWSGTPWSEWSFAFCAYDPQRRRWVEGSWERLEGGRRPNAHSVVRIGPNPARECADDDSLGSHRGAFLLFEPGASA